MRIYSRGDRKRPVDVRPDSNTGNAARYHNGARLQPVAGHEFRRNHRRRAATKSSRPRATAAQLPTAINQAQSGKIGVVRRKIEFARSVADDWSQHEALAGTQKGLGSMRSISISMSGPCADPEAD